MPCKPSVVSFPRSGRLNHDYDEHAMGTAKWEWVVGMQIPWILILIIMHYFCATHLTGLPQPLFPHQELCFKSKSKFPRRTAGAAPTTTGGLCSIWWVVNCIEQLFILLALSEFWKETVRQKKKIIKYQKGAMRKFSSNGKCFKVCYKFNQWFYSLCTQVKGKMRRNAQTISTHVKM